MGWFLLWIGLAFVFAEPARATSAGTVSTAVIDLPGDALDGEQIERTEDLPVSTSSTWLTDGTTAAGAITPFGETHARVTSAADGSAVASSSWIDTLTLTSAGGATGAGELELHLRLRGSLAAGTFAGGYAQAALRAYLGLPGPDDALAPASLFAATSFTIDDACELDALPCDETPAAVDALVILHADVAYDTPFRFGVLLEALGWSGGSADFESGGAWLERVRLPAGAGIAAASGRDYSPLFEVVPEPGTITLLGSALVALAARRRA